MIAFLSPAKNMLEAEVLAQGHPHAEAVNTTMKRIPAEMLTQPIFAEDAFSIAQELKSYNPWQLESIMDVNPELALKAFGQLQRFDPDSGELPAILSYHGLQYQHLAAWEFSQEEFLTAQKCLRIISGIYGVLRPLDRVMAYRLEMQCRQPICGKKLYAYWNSRLCEQLFSEDDTLINLASKEYSRAILPYANGRRIITCDFLIEKPAPKGGKVLRTIATAAKMARGAMAGWIVRQRPETPEQLMDFSLQGFRFIPGLSTDTHYVFSREDLPLSTERA